ncbi:multivesicular body subunit 12B-like [Lineus longissimus]|uniref:multivesicular body subunit 12B-like n=1 Tax=Lineus longissimus TaxID=88925 RepID=UPI002B4D94B5
MQDIKDDVPTDLPITGVCIVADLSKIPAGFKAIDRSYDKYEDADLWKDSFFAARKVYRYFCVTREIKSVDVIAGDVVLADIALLNDRESVPPGFAPIDRTIDTGDKATKGKRVVIKMIQRDTTTDGICELIILSKSKRPPGDYTLVGELNGLALCFKMGPVPRNPNAQNSVKLPYAFPGQVTQPGGTAYWNGKQQQTGYHQQSSTYREPRVETTHTINVQQAPIDSRLSEPSYGQHSGYGQHAYGSGNATTLQRHFATSPLSGVPFQLHKKFADSSGLSQCSLPNIGYKTMMEIERDFEYNFTVEKSVRSRSPST